jgi:hypothetical protein
MLGRNLPSSSSVDILTDQSIYGIKNSKMELLYQTIHWYARNFLILVLT